MTPPRKLSLARTPTPLEPLRRMSAHLGVDLWLKRDDQTGLELSGNKVRKLEYLLAEAQDLGADTVITCGGEQSNHCRATAMAAAKLGLRCHVLLRTTDPSQPPAATDNILLDRLAGATVHWMSRPDWRRRAELMAQVAETVRGAGGTPYIIPEGGSNALGAWGYIDAAYELMRDLAALPAVPRTTIVCATGSGGTAAGLIAGVAMHRQTAVRVATVNVCDDHAYFADVIGRLLGELHERWGLPTRIAEPDIIDGYVGAGYASAQPDELACLRELCRLEGVVLDPVYTGKAFYGVTRELARDPARFGERVVFVHTGGVFGLNPFAAQFAALPSAT